MIIRSAALNTTRRTLPVSRPIAPRQLTQQGPIDSFEPALPVVQPPILSTRSAQTVAPASGSSSSGGLFSRLWRGIKKMAGGWLGKARTWLSTNMGGLISKATRWVSDLMRTWLTKAGTWLSGLLAAWQQKLGA